MAGTGGGDARVSSTQAGPVAVCGQLCRAGLGYEEEQGTFTEPSRGLGGPEVTLGRPLTWTKSQHLMDPPTWGFRVCWTETAGSPTALSNPGTTSSASGGKGWGAGQGRGAALGDLLWRPGRWRLSHIPTSEPRPSHPRCPQSPEGSREYAAASARPARGFRGAQASPAAEAGQGRSWQGPGMARLPWAGPGPPAVQSP